MRILVVGLNYWPEESGNPVFTVRRCEYLASRGHEVTICTGFPYYPQWRICDEYRGRLFARETHNGVTILRSYVYVPRRVTSARRIIHEASFVASSLARALGQKKPDLVLVVSAPLGLAVPAFVLTRLWRVPYVFHVQDMQPDAAMDLGMLRPKLLFDFLYRLERFAYRKAALVSALTERMRQRIIAKGVPAGKVVVFSHCADQSLFSVPPGAGGEVFRKQHDLGDRFVVLHSGNMGVKQGLEVAIEAARLSRDDPRIVYLLVGDGVARPALVERASAFGVDNVRFLPLQPKEIFVEMLAAADVCLITERQSVADILFPGKTLAFLAAGRPMIASLGAYNEAADVVARSGAGLVVEPEDPRALLDAIVRMRSDTAGRLAMGERGRVWAREHWDPERILPWMETQLVRLAANGNLSGKAAMTIRDGLALSEEEKN